MSNKPHSPLRTDFLAGLAVLLPAVVSILVLIWFVGAVSGITDRLLFAVPAQWKYVGGVKGEIHWHWSLAAFLFAAVLVTVIGRLTRHYIGRQLVHWGDRLLLQVPLLNSIYSTVKQVKEALIGHKSSFQQTVLVEFPRPGVYSLGFITGSERDAQQMKTPAAVWSVFIPTTPNPTTGFLIFVPESEVIRLEMSVADAIKSIISLGAVAPEPSATSGPEMATSRS